MDHPDLTVSNFMEDSIGCIRVKNDNTFSFSDSTEKFQYQVYGVKALW